MEVELVDCTNENVKNFVKNLYKTLQQKIIDEELATYSIAESYYLTATGKRLDRNQTNVPWNVAPWCGTKKGSFLGAPIWCGFHGVSSVDPEGSKTWDITNGAGSVRLGSQDGLPDSSDCVRIFDFEYDFNLNCGHTKWDVLNGDRGVGLWKERSTSVSLELKKSLAYGIKKINNSHNKYQAFISNEGTFKDSENIKLNRKFHYNRKKEELQNIENLLGKKGEDNAYIFFVKDKLKELCGKVNLLYKTPISLNEEYKDFNQENEEYNINVAKQNIKILSDALDSWGNNFNYDKHNKYDKYLFRIHLGMSLEHDRNQTLFVSVFYDNDLLLELEAIGTLDFSNKTLSNSANYTINLTCQKDGSLWGGDAWLNWSIPGTSASFYRSPDGNIFDSADYTGESNQVFRDFLSAYAPLSNNNMTKPTANTNVTINKLKINNFYGSDCTSFIKEVFCDNSTAAINGIKNNIKVV